MRWYAALLVVSLVVAGLPAAAHEPTPRAMGVIEMATATRLVVRLADGHAISYAVTPETRFLVGRRPASLEDARAGRRVVVLARPSSDGMEAVRVKLGVEAGK